VGYLERHCKKRGGKRGSFSGIENNKEEISIAWRRGKKRGFGVLAVSKQRGEAPQFRKATSSKREQAEIADREEGGKDTFVFPLWRGASVPSGNSRAGRGGCSSASDGKRKQEKKGAKCR